MRPEVLLDARQPRGREVQRGLQDGAQLAEGLLNGADLHSHSYVSDGTDAPRRVAEAAFEAGLAAFALTDHDTTEGLAEAQERGRSLGIEVIPGIEISAEHGGREVHLLAYFVDPGEPLLASRLGELRVERSSRIARIVARLNEAGIGVTFDDVRAHASGDSIGRPHVADALVRGGWVPSYEHAWSEFLRSGGRAYVPRGRLTIEESARLVRAAGGAVSMAHPTLNLELAQIEEVARSGIDAIETKHPDVTDADSAALAEICRRHGLIETGGSDSHGARRGGRALGSVRVPLEVVERLRALAARSRPT